MSVFSRMAEIDEEEIDLLKKQRDHARALAESLVEVMMQFPTSIEDFGIQITPAPGDQWEP